jgi:hypothetical protein
MSRGFGRQQRMMLLALQDLEQRWGQEWFYVHAIVRAAWPLGAGDAYARRKQRHDDAYAAWKAEEEQDRQETAALAATGDEAAMKRLELFRYLDSLGRGLRRRRQEWRGAPLLRPEKDADAAFNPSRTWRCWNDGGWSVGVPTKGQAQRSHSLTPDVRGAKRRN